ncbi:MAG: putative Holliday junction resolvase [Paracoccaceae bacterium]|jgi:putative Holliday junction resolvase
MTASPPPAPAAGVVDIETLSRLLRPGDQLICLDVGTKTVGVALSDGMQMTASPISTVRRKKFTADVAAIFSLVARRQIGGVVIGLPVHMSGEEGPRSESSRAFARNLSRITPLPIVLWDERMSTMAAERSLLEVDASRAKRAEVIDAVAASYILQGALARLDTLRGQRRGYPQDDDE